MLTINRFLTSIPIHFESKPSSFHFPLYTTLEGHLETIKEKFSQNSSYTLSPSEKEEIKQSLKKSQNWLSEGLKKKLHELPLEKVIPELLEDTDVEEWLSYAVKSLDDNQLHTFYPKTAEEIQSKRAAQNLLREEALKSVLQTKSFAVIKEIASQSFYFFDHVLNLLIEATGIRDLNPDNSVSRGGRPTTTSLEAKARLEIYAAIFLVPTLLCATVFSQVGSLPLAILITALMVTTFILFLIYYDRYLKPCPQEFSFLDNLNNRVKRAVHDPIFERYDVNTQIEGILSSGKGVLVIGKPGEGKSTTFLSLAEKVVEKQSSEKMNKVTMFATNAQQFISSAFRQDTLSFAVLDKRFDRQEKNVLFVIDEIAALFESPGSLKQLLTFVDRFKMTITATTTREFIDVILKDEKMYEAFLRRFDVVLLDPLDDESIEASLYATSRYRNPELDAEPDVMNYICKRAFDYKTNLGKIDAAQALLSCAITKATHKRFEELEKEISQLKIDHTFLKNKLLQCNTTSQADEKKFLELDAQLKLKEREHAQKKQQLETVKKLEKIYIRYKQEAYTLASKDERTWLQNQVTLSLLERAIEVHKTKVGIPIKLNKSLIDKVIEEKKINQAKIKDFIEKSQK